MDQIQLTGMDFFGCHGCLPEERKNGQHFLVDLVMDVDLKAAGETDNLNATVNYAHVYELVQEIVEGEPKNLIEAVAEKIAQVVLKDFALVQKLRVTVHKPAAPIPGKFQDVAVTLERERA